jgi:hypothetical protein
MLARSLRDAQPPFKVASRVSTRRVQMPRIPATALAAATALLVFLTVWLNYALPVRWGLDIGQVGGNVGGIFGFSSALFTGLAFVGLVYAVKLQRDELQIARDSLESAKAELRIASANQKTFNDQIDIQNKESQKKSFEDTFFKMLYALDQILNSIRLRDSVTHFSTSEGGGIQTETFEISSIMAINKINESFHRRLHNFLPKDTIQETYDTFYSEHRGHIGHYFRWLFCIIDFIESSEINGRDFYIKLLISRLSDEEIILIAHNGAGSEGKILRPYIEKYQLLKNLNTSSPYIENDLIRGIYKPSAFE